MAEELINITAPQYRCNYGACPAVYTDRTPERYRCGPIASSCPAVLDDDSGNFIFIGEHLGPVPGELAGKIGATEAAVKLSAELVLSSLGIPALIGAWEPILDRLEDEEARFDLDDEDKVGISYRDLQDLREAFKAIGGSNG